MGSRLALSDLIQRSRSRAGWTLLCGLVVGLLSVTALAAPPKPKSAKARKHFDKAVELYTAKDYDGAVAEAEAGVAIEEHESLLFIWAQAERQRGNCVEAVELFDRFIEATDNEAMSDNALTAKAMCAEELAEQARIAEAEAAAAAAAEAAAAEEEEQAEATPAPPPPEPFYRDPLGGVLVGVGGAAVLGGGALLIATAVLDPRRADNVGEFGRRFELQPKLGVAGGVTAGIGVALVVGGAVRWMMVDKQTKQAAATQSRVGLGPWLAGDRSGVVISGRF